MFYVGLGTREWVDRIEWVRMTPSELGRCSQFLLLGSLGSSLHRKKYVLYINSYSSTLQQPEGAGRGG